MIESNKTLQTKILAVLKNHPDGINLRDIGNCLGVNWRSLIGAVGSLSYKGKIEKLNGHCFIANGKQKNNRRFK